MFSIILSCFWEACNGRYKKRTRSYHTFCMDDRVSFLYSFYSLSIIFFSPILSYFFIRFSIIFFSCFSIIFFPIICFSILLCLIFLFCFLILSLSSGSARICRKLPVLREFSCRHRHPQAPHRIPGRFPFR